MSTSRTMTSLSAKPLKSKVNTGTPIVTKSTTENFSRWYKRQHFLRTQPTSQARHIRLHCNEISTRRCDDLRYSGTFSRFGVSYFLGVLKLYLPLSRRQY